MALSGTGTAITNWYYADDAVYTTAQTAALATGLIANPNASNVGQYEIGGNFRIQRAIENVVISGGLPAGLAEGPGIILTASYKFRTLDEDKSTQDFDIVVVDGSEGMQVPVAGDYGDLLDEITSFGSWNTADWVALTYFTIVLNAEGIAYLNSQLTSPTELGYLKLALRSSQDISATEPPLRSYISIFAGGSNSKPELILTFILKPTVTTDAASGISDTAATLNGTLTYDGGEATDCNFEWGITTNYGNTTAAQSKSINGAGSQAFSQALSDLLPNTLYHFRAKAENQAGIAYGDDASFTTKSLVEGGSTKAQGFVSSIRRHFRKDATNSQGGVYTIEVGLGAFGSGITSFTSPDRSDPTAIPGPDLYKYGPNIAQIVEQALGSQIFGPNIAQITAQALGTQPQSFSLGSFTGAIGPDLAQIVRQTLSSVTPSGEEMSPTIRTLHKYYPRLYTPFGTLESRLTRLENSSPGPYPSTTEAVLKTLFDAQTVLAATSDDIPAALTVPEQTVVGRETGGNIAAIALGIADNNILQMDDADAADDDYVKLTAAGAEGRSYQELVNDISGVLKATDVEVSELSTATYDDVQDYISFFGDRTLLSGGVISDNGDGTAAMASCTAWLKVSDSDTAVGVFLNFAGDGSIALTDQLTSHIYLDYNGGTPQVVVATDMATHGFKQDHLHLATVFREGTTLHIHPSDKLGIGRMGRINMHHSEESVAHRANGIVTSGTGTRQLAVTAGVLYEGLNRHTSLPFDTSRSGTADFNEANKLHDAGADFAATDVGKSVHNTTDDVYGLITAFIDSTELTLATDAFPDGNEAYHVDWWSYWYYDGDLGPAAWVEVPGTTQIDNVQYNAVATGLANLTANRYGVHWVFMDIDGTHLHIVYGQGNYKANEAEEAGVPSSLPDIVTNYSFLIAKIINQQGTNTLITAYPWFDTLPSTMATDHGSLGGLEDVADHAYALLHNGTRALSGAWDMGSQALTNVNIDSGVITGITDLAVADGGTGASNAGDARTNLGLVIGTNVLAYDAGLQNLAGVSMAANKMYYTSGDNVHVATDLSAFGRTWQAYANAAAGMAGLSGQASTEFLFNTQQVGGVVDPTTDQQAATKKYVDDNITSGAMTHPQVLARVSLRG